MEGRKEAKEYTKAKFDEWVAHTIRVYSGNSCFDYKCKGKMDMPVEAGHLLSCNVCGTGLKRTSLESYVNSKPTGLDYVIRSRKEEIEHNLARVQELKREIAELKTFNKDHKAVIKTTRKELAIYRKAGTN